MITASGLGSGLDIQGLVDSLVAAERSGSDLRLNRESAKLQSKFSALGSLKGALSNFQSSLGGISSLATFTANNATSSKSSALSVSADSSAQEGNYSFSINQLAQSQSLASLGVAETDTALGTGSLTISFGTTDYDSGSDIYNGFVQNTEKSSLILNIDSSNNTLEGIMRAINQAEAGVKASIVFDGSGHRLLLSSDDTGVASSMQVTVADGDGNNTDQSGLSFLAFNASATNLEQTVAAQDASLTINGLTISSASNTVDDAIQGLSFTLKEVSAEPVQVAVQPNTAGVKSAVETFVDGYNDFIKIANNLSAYDPETRRAAALVGDFTLRSVETQIGGILRGAVAIPGESFRSLAELGITTTADGTLTLNDAKFDAALGDDPQRVAQMFTSFGVASDVGVSYLGSSDMTAAGVYNVNVTALAEAGFYTGSSVLPSFSGNSVLIDSDNDSLTVSIDGIESGSINLTQGVYGTGEDLAAEVQARINAASPLANAGLSVLVTYNSSTASLSITSDTVGSASRVDIVAADNATAATLGLAVGAGTQGADMVALINGVQADAIGNILEGAEGTDVEGLRLEVNTATLGSLGSVTFTRGVGASLNVLMDQLLGVESSLNDRIESLDNRIDSIEERRSQLELRWEAVRARYTSQFNGLDSLLGQLQGTSQFLEQQLNGLIQLNRTNS
ncbi:MAG: flagellar filament capping protein FliD [Gammaproteobacteria bacterium]